MHTSAVSATPATSLTGAVAHIELAPSAPYDFTWALAWLRTSSAAILEAIDDGGTYRRALHFAGHDVLLEFRSTGTIGTPRLMLTLHGDRLGARLRQDVTRYVRRLFQLDTDPTSFLSLAAGDPVLAALTRRFAGFRPVLIASPYEALLWAILGQQVNVSFARTLKRTLITLTARHLAHAGRLYSVFPDPATVAALDPVLLREHHFSRQKARYVVELSHAVAVGALDFDTIAAMPHADAIQALTRYKGIGRWTAEYVLMRGLGHPDSIPAADLGLRAVMGRAYGLGRTATEAEVRELASVWAGWRSWGAFCWWLVLQLGQHGSPDGFADSVDTSAGSVV